jgi:acyl-coenzyme A thioesterase PaaI-like protein
MGSSPSAHKIPFPIRMQAMRTKVVRRVLSSFSSSTARSSNAQKDPKLWYFLFATAATVTATCSALTSVEIRDAKIRASKNSNVAGFLSSSRTSPMTMTLPTPSTLLNKYQRKMTFFRPTISPSTILCASQGIYQQTTEEEEETKKELTILSDDEINKSYYYEYMDQPDPSEVESHAILGTLMKPGSIERYRVYRRVYNRQNPKSVVVSSENNPYGEEVAVSSVRFGKNLDGHDRIVHGGIISLCFDDSFGWGYEAMGRSIGKTYGDKDFPIVVTANLSVDYRSPLPSETDIVIKIFHQRTEGRKIYMTARMESPDGSILYSEAKVLFFTIQKKTK